ncbi:hypothetical protein GH714_007646 [Hevea brasiliensis]|uniref:Serine-threonine/tyrosine-protein kinase catalytic domain-containing protein n=1 Tax=Hevea brasiliensis TaxID=3981 RepID=A0A6A6MST2_HEVBR|nr:hypothetical protein GH714_007646 [Hevea brasiliensis]
MGTYDYNSFQQKPDDFDSTFKWGLAASIILSIISTIAFIAIVFAIIDCLKKATSVIPDYARLATTEKSAKQESLGNQVAITITEQEFPVIPDTQVQFATMERFLSNIAKEKPISESRQWLPRWTWDMYKNNELELMLSLCGIEQKHKEKAKRMAIVALQCVQHSPDARPAMSDVVKMLEGSIEILQEPSNPFEYLESFGPNIGLLFGNDEDSSSVSRRHISEPPYLVPRRGMEIELASG